MTVLRCVTVEPDGSRLVRTTHGDVWVGTYPSEAVREGRALRDLRVARGYGLREAARLLGLHAAGLSAIEIGAQRFVDRDAAWREAEARWPGRSAA